MKPSLFLLPFLGILGIACTPESSDSALLDDTNEIQGGKPEAGYLAVGFLNVGCTGTLITPTVVLTAGHCVYNPVTSFIVLDGTTAMTPVGFVPTTPVGSVSGSSIASGTRFVRTRAQRAYPGYSRPSAICPSAIPDLGLVELAEPIMNVPAMTMAVGVPEIGAAVFGVGYGLHNDDAGAHSGVGWRYSAWESVSGFGAHTTTVSGVTGIADHGDSGGPLISNNQIVGTVSCETMRYPNPSRIVHYERIDTPDATNWISSVIAEWSAESLIDAGAPSL